MIFQESEKVELKAIVVEDIKKKSLSKKAFPPLSLFQEARL